MSGHIESRGPRKIAFRLRNLLREQVDALIGRVDARFGWDWPYRRYAVRSGELFEVYFVPNQDQVALFKQCTADLRLEIVIIDEN